MAIGLYLTPDWTLPRVAGAVAFQIWQFVDYRSHMRYAIILASGFVLGEGLAGIGNAVLKSLNVPHL